MKTTRFVPASFALALLLLAVAVPRISATNVSEPPDFPNVTAGPATSLTAGANVFSGTLTTPGDGQDRFNVTVPAGFRMTQATKTFVAGGGVQSPNISFNGENLSGTGAGTFQNGYPLGPGTYSAIVSAGLSVGNAWTNTFTVGAAPDYSISTAPGYITVTDDAGNGDTLGITNPVTGFIKFVATGRTFAINGGPLLSNDSGNLSLSGVSDIAANAGAGNNTINVSGFTGSSFPNLTINGGTGDDTVNFNGDITFATGKSLDVNLQSGGGSHGVDTINVAPNAHLIASGSGNITLLCSKNIALASGALLQVAQGGLDMEANQQEPPTPGNFIGVDLETATLSATSSSTVTVKGRGGDDASGSQLGVYVNNGAKIIGSTSPAFINVTGTGGASTGILNRGVTVYGAGSAISTPAGGQVIVTGTAGANGGFYGIGVSVLYGGVISGGGAGCYVTGTGRGAPGSGFNQGIELGEAGSLISSIGDIHLTGTAGPGGSAAVFVDHSAAVTTTAGTGKIGITADTFSIDATSVVAPTNAASFVVFTPIAATNIDLGGAGGPGTLGLSDATLDQVSAANLFIDENATTSITISAPITRSNATSLYLQPGPGGVRATATGTDLSLLTGTLHLLGTFSCPISNTTPDSGFAQLKVLGDVNLTGASLTLANTTFTGTLGNTFTIINNAGPNAIIGTFAGLPEGGYLAWPGSSTLAAKISYAGGDGNDVVLTLVPVAQALVVATNTITGPGSLPAVLTLAASIPGAKTITFNSSLAGQTITLAGELVINDTNAVTIDATSLPTGLTISGNHATRLFSVPGGHSLTLGGLTLSGGNGAGAALNGNGGAILNEGTLSLSQCTLSGNAAANGDGGAISQTLGTLTMTNCTLTGNSAADAGAILNSVNSTATLTHCTLTLNRSTSTDGNSFGGGAIDNFSSTLTLNNCILAGNTSASPSGPDLWQESGTLTTTNCLIGNGTSSTMTDGVNGNHVGSAAKPLDARLLPLGDYGGLTQTMPPRADSPAVDAAPGSTLNVDQRGVDRPVNGDFDGAAVRDIGAVEFNNFVEVTTAADDLDVPAGATLSLREALRDAPEGALISFSPLVFTPAAHTIALNFGELLPAKDLVITANNLPAGVTLDGQNFSRLLSVSTNAVDITAASGTTATQSSDYSASLYLAGNGINGDSSDFTSTGNTDPAPTWTADFHRDVVMTLVRIINRTSCCGQRLSDVTVTLLDSHGGVLYTSPVLNAGNVLSGPASLSVILPGPLAVRQVRISRNPGAAVGDERVLSIAELQVFNLPTVTLKGLTLTGGNGTGAVFNGNGGAALNLGILTLSQCTVMSNSVAGAGGGIYGQNAGSSLTLDRCTLVGNQAGSFGGAFENLTSELVNLSHCTVSGNSAGSAGGGLDNYTASAAITNCIIAGNSSANGADINNDNATLTRAGANIVQTVSTFGSATSSGPAAINAAPLLVPPGNYGGCTMTMALMPGSPARNAAVGSSATSDQRGFPIVGIPDIGAYEAGTYKTYNIWAVETISASFPPGSNARDADPDGDGRINAIEYATLTSATDSNPGSALTFTLNSTGTNGTNTFNYQANATDLFYQLDRSTNLPAVWTTLFDFRPSTAVTNVFVPGVTATTNGNLATITDGNITGWPRAFYRLRVTISP